MYKGDMSMAKHTWKRLPNGEIDDNAMDKPINNEYDCNGPKCIICGFSFCEHCNPYGYFDNSCPEDIKKK